MNESATIALLTISTAVLAFLVWSYSQEVRKLRKRESANEQLRAKLSREREKALQEYSKLEAEFRLLQQKVATGRDDSGRSSAIRRSSG